MKKRWITLCLTAFFSICGPLTHANTENKTPILLESMPITSGAVRETYAWEATSGRTIIHVIKVDLNNPYVVLDAISKDQKIAQRAGLSTIARSTEAIAAINADFFNMQAEGAPIGVMVSEARLMSSPARLENLFALGIDDTRTAHIESFKFSGTVTSAAGTQFELAGLNKTIYWEEPVSAHSHVNKLHLYNDAWGREQRGNDSMTTPTEVVVKDGLVLSMHVGSYFPGLVPEGAYILRGHGTAAEFLKTLKVGEPVAIQYNISPNKNWTMVMGGHSLLVDQGKTVAYSRNLGSVNALTSRSAMGISKDGKTVYLVAVERNSVYSNGLSLRNLSAFFEFLNVWKAVNLDGGGSTTMVSRPLGSFDIVRVFTPQEGSERAIANGIGIFSIAPKGDVMGIEIESPRHVLLNQEVPFTLKTFDTFYNPINLSPVSADWSVGQPLGQFSNNLFRANAVGTSTVQARVGALSATREIQVLGRDDIQSMTVQLATNTQAEKTLRVTIKTLAGANVNVPANLVKWSFHGGSGSVSPEGRLNFVSGSNPSIGLVIADYDGFKAPLVLQYSGEKLALALEALNGISFETHPSGVLGGLKVATDPSKAGQSVIEMSYDFGAISGTTAAYLKFNGEGMRLEPLTESVTLDVYGNNKGEWIRAEVVDGKGDLHRLDFTRSVNWTGWRKTEMDVSHLAQPLVLKRIYVVGTDQTTTRKGTLLFRNIVHRFGGGSGEVLKQPELRLTLNKKVMSVNGKDQAIDVAPLIIDDRTMVPIRFISEAFGATVNWDQDTQNASILKGRNVIDLWYEGADMVVDGVRTPLDVKPQIVNNRMMIPLRAVAESMNITVHWDAATQTIILR